MFAWDNPNVPVDEVMNDILRAFHHPALRDQSIELQRDMFLTVKKWADEHPRRHELERILSSESVKKGKNHILNQSSGSGSRDVGGHACGSPFEGLQLGHGKVSGSLWSQVQTRDLNSIQGNDGDASANYTSSESAPPGARPPNQGYNYDNQGPSSGGYSGNTPQPGYYQGGGYNQPPPPGQYGGPPSGYGGSAPPPGPGYGGPPAGGQWGGGPPPPPQGYGGPGYGGPPPPGPGYGGPPPQQYAPYQQGPPTGQPPNWNQYPGQGRY